MLDPGRLDQRITLQAPEGTRDSYGGASTAWIDIATVWADCQSLSGREYLAARAEVAETIIKVRIRWRADITTRCRVVWESRHYGIEAVLDTGGRHEELVLMCKEIV